MRDKLLMVIYFCIVVLFITFVFIRIKSDRNYLMEHEIKVDNYSSITDAKGYLIGWDSENNQALSGSEEGVDVTYKVVNAMQNKANVKGYKNYYLEVEASFKTYYKVNEDGSVDNKTSYFVFAPDFYDLYTGVYFLDTDMNDTFKTKKIVFNDKEYSINYKSRKEEIKSEWNVIDINNKTMNVTIKYYFTFEVPNNYKGLLMGINGAYNGFNEDSNLWHKITTSDSYILDAYNTNSKLYKVDTIMKEG